jgi:ABC-type branched-subunit amino acid transport system substrate-binding protein
MVNRIDMAYLLLGFLLLLTNHVAVSVTKTVAPTAAPTNKVTSRLKNVIRIGAAIPMLTQLEGDVDNIGIQRVAAFIVAIKDMKQELKSLNYTVKFALRDSKRTFSNSVVAALDLVTNVFNGTGVHGVIGAGSNTETLAMTYVTQDYDVGEIAYASDKTDLSHELIYPDFARVYPSSSFQAVALAEIVANKFKWTRVVIAYTADSYGIDALAEFKVQVIIFLGTYLSFPILNVSFGNALTYLSISVCFLSLRKTSRPRNCTST